MSGQSELLHAISNRYSLRTYDPNPLDDTVLDSIEQMVQTTETLLPANSMNFSLLRNFTEKDRTAALSIFNPLIHPRHILIIWNSASDHAYTDLGFRMEQAAVQLQMMGIGSCFIGTLGREESLNTHFNLPPNSVTGAVLAVGKPAKVNKSMKVKNRLSLEKIAFLNDFSTPLTEPGDLVSILEAARVAPSATNAQPWRLLWIKPDLYLFVTPKKLANLLSADFKKYCLYDGGICMANISLALKSLNMPAEWQMLNPSSPMVPQCPQELIPLGKIKIEI